MSSTARAAEDDPPLLRLEDIRQVFPNGTVALRGVDLDVHAGSVHGLVGANGAGKSTLIKILSGALRASAGRILWRGRPAVWPAPRAALQAGVATIHQHIPLVPTLSVRENVFLGRGTWQRRSRAQTAEFTGLTARVGYAIDPRAIVGDLPIGQRQMVAILQALAGGADLVIMDEPTASLAAAERDLVFEVIRRLSAEGTAFLYVSHFLDEILDLTDHVTVLRDGRVVAHGPTDACDEDTLVRSIVGTDLLAVQGEPAPAPPADAPVLLEARGLRSPGAVDGVTLAVRAGEVVGLAGLLGSGRSEILHALFRADPRCSGEVRMAGRPLPRSTRAAVAAGLALVPEDRAAQGLVGTFALWRNTSLPDLPALAHGSIVPAAAQERERAREAIAALGIVAPGVAADVAQLSGGNAQKVVFAKWMFGRASVFLLDEPTAGVDVGVKADILQLVRGFAAEGKGVVMVSSEFEELLAVASRILVVRQGRIVAERAPAQTSEAELLMLASGLTRRTDAA